MFLFDAYTGEAEFRLNVHVTKYVIISREGLPADIPALNFKAMDASFAKWGSEITWIPVRGPHRDEQGLTVMTPTYLAF